MRNDEISSWLLAGMRKSFARTQLQYQLGHEPTSIDKQSSGEGFVLSVTLTAAIFAMIECVLRSGEVEAIHDQRLLLVPRRKNSAF